jgi:hypothetical protein
MWRRLMRKTMAPGRPPLFMEQWALALVTLVLLGLGIVAALGLWR